MNKVLSIILITILTLFLSVKTVKATILTQGYLASEIKKKAQELIQKEIEGDLSLTIDSSYLNNIEIPYNQYKINVICNSTRLNPITIFKVNVIADGKVQRTFGVPIKISIFETVAIATSNIQRGETLTSNNIKFEKKDVSFNYENITKKSNQIDGYISGKLFRAGDVIDKRFLSPPPDIVKNCPVSIIFKSNEITVSLDGEAMENGKIGDYIKVKNKKYKRQYKGKIIDQGTVIVNL